MSTEKKKLMSSELENHELRVSRNCFLLKGSDSQVISIMGQNKGTLAGYVAGGGELTPLLGGIRRMRLRLGLPSALRVISTLVLGL